MIKKKALNKILITTISIFVILSVYLIPNINKEEVLKTNLELEYISGIGTNSIYLLDENNYLVKSKILLTSNDKKKKVERIISSLIIDNKNSSPESLKGVIPKKTKLLDTSLTLYFLVPVFNIIHNSSSLDSISLP